MKNNFLKSPTGSADALRVLLNFWLEPGIFANLFSSLFGTVSRWRRRRSPCFPDQGRGHGPRGRTRLHQHGRSQGASQYLLVTNIPTQTDQIPFFIHQVLFKRFRGLNVTVTIIYRYPSLHLMVLIFSPSTVPRYRHELTCSMSGMCESIKN